MLDRRGPADLRSAGGALNAADFAAWRRTVPLGRPAALSGRAASIGGRCEDRPATLAGENGTTLAEAQARPVGRDLRGPFSGVRASGLPFTRQRATGLRFHARIRASSVRCRW